jgi:DNA repair exonuclease SbcCD ATPase subunit
MIAKTSFRWLPAVLLLFSWGTAHAQVGGLIKKKLDKAAGKDAAEQAVDAPVVFDKVTLEITQERIEKLTAAKLAVRKFLEGPTGPAAYEKQITPLDNRQTAIYSKQVDNINGWDEKRRDYERCMDSAFSAIHDRKSSQVGVQAMSDPAAMRKAMEWGQALAAAQQKGDTAAVRKITEQLGGSKAPTKADSVEAAKHCVYPPQPPLVTEYLGLKRQLDSLGNLRQEAESQAGRMEESMSGMNARQSAVFCERIKQFVQQLKEKKKHVGFSDDEIKRLAKLEQAIKALEALCP